MMPDSLVLPNFLCAVNLLGQFPLVELVHPDTDQVAGVVVLSCQTDRFFTGGFFKDAAGSGKDIDYA